MKTCAWWRAAVLAGLLAAPGLAPGAGSAEDGTVAGLPPGEALRLGERIYREGLLPSGEPVQAIVQEDIPVDGTMFTCVSCHLRSGLGSTEGQVVVTATNGPRLYRPRAQGDAWKRAGSAERARFGKEAAWEALPEVLTGRDLRPAYTDQSLATALRVGKDPTGRKFDPIMPRYLLGERDMALLVHYLKNLSARLSPGVTESALRFATVVCDDADPVTRDAFVTALQAFVRDHNAQSRQQTRRAQRGPFYRYEMTAHFRTFEAEVWELKGPRETWRAQLEDRYRANPVFALLGGVSGGSWEPIHRFCEDLRVPCLFPLTPLPVVSDTDWYTLYFSKGFQQEGEAAARYLRGPARLGKEAAVVQLHRATPEGRALARGFQDRWTGYGNPTPAAVELPEGEPLDEQVWGEVCGKDPAAVLLWLGEKDLEGLDALQKRGLCRPPLSFASSTLLAGSLGSVPDGLRESLHLTWPRALPAEAQQKKVFVENWLRVRQIPVTDFEAQSKAYFLGWMLGAGLMDIREEFYRDYFLDMIDMMIDQSYAIAVYPRLSFGPGQRYASTGCYVVQLGPGPEPEVTARSGWVSH